MKGLTAISTGILLAAAFLGGCASAGVDHSTGLTGAAPESGGDITAMCNMHKKMMGSMSQQDQKAMMDEHMKNMSPEMRAKHIEQMKQCM